VAAVQALVTGTLLSCLKIARRTGVTPGCVSVFRRKHGWERPAVRAGSRRFAASHRTGVLAETGDRRGRPYSREVRLQAQVMWEDTRLPTALIGARLGVHPATVARWSVAENWTRPHGRAGARQLRGYFASLGVFSGGARG
jgi:uncharacterized protein YjcR